MFICDPWASRSSPTATKLNPFGIPNACELQSRQTDPLLSNVKTCSLLASWLDSTFSYKFLPFSFCPMEILERIRQRAAAKPQHIVLPEGNDRRTVLAAANCAHTHVARITLLGDEETIRKTAEREGADLSGVAVIDHRRAADFEKMASLFHDLRRAKGLMADEARTMLSDPLYYGNLMVRLGTADGSVAGATNTTSHTVRAALHCIGVRQGFKLVSSFFLMALRDAEFGHHGALIFADCGVVIQPTAAELAEIAIASADSCRALIGVEPRVAMLSFSTKGSARHKLVDKVVEATRTIRARAPELLID